MHRRRKTNRDTLHEQMQDIYTVDNRPIFSAPGCQYALGPSAGLTHDKDTIPRHIDILVREILGDTLVACIILILARAVNHFEPYLCRIANGADALLAHWPAHITV